MSITDITAIYPVTFKIDQGLSASRETFLYFDLTPWISVLSEHRNVITWERLYWVRPNLTEISDIPPLTTPKANACGCESMMWKTAVSDHDLFSSPLLLFPYLLPVKNVRAEWFSFGKCDLTELRHSMVMCWFSRRLERRISRQACRLSWSPVAAQT